MDLERRVFSPNNDEGRAEAAVPPHEMDEATQKLYNTIQNMLALIAYVEHNKLAISPSLNFLRRQDEAARKVRRHAADEWGVFRPEDPNSHAALFRSYWTSNRSDVESIDLENPTACLGLINKIDGLRKENPKSE